MKERIDVSLDNRHIVSFLIAGIVVFGAVFILGVVVGKKLAATEQAAVAPDPLSALDQKAEAADTKNSDFTFQEELTKKTPGSADTSGPKRAAVPSKAKGSAPLDISGPKPIVEPVVPVPNQAAPSESAVAVREEEVQPTQGKEVSRLPPKAELKSVAARVGTKDRGLRDVMARAERDPTPVTGGPGHLREASPAPGQHHFTLQVSSTQSRPEADRFVMRLRDKGYAPFVVQAQLPGRGKWYRVRLGNFPTKEAASRYLADFRRETRLDAFITND